MEISLKNAHSVWEVHRKTAFGYAESSEYNLCSVTVKGTQSVFSVNGYEALAYSATSFANGGFGVQTRGSKLLVDYIQISLDGNDLMTTLSSVLTCVSNVGLGFNQAGPGLAYAFYSDFSKMVLSFLMIAGRLELFSFFMLFSSHYWNTNKV
jgi:Trk-type K+ transport system membrane component